jgi:hypothetical protein
MDFTSHFHEIASITKCAVSQARQLSLDRKREIIITHWPQLDEKKSTEPTQPHSELRVLNYHQHRHLPGLKQPM